VQSLLVRPHESMVMMEFHIMADSGIMAPFGRPVVPPVYRIMAGSLVSSRLSLSS